MPIVIARADGGVELLYLVAGVNAQDEINKWKAARPDEYVSHREVTTTPTDRTFRNAWKPDLNVDMTKACEIQRDRLRVLRKPLLDAADEEFLRALETGDTSEQARIAAKKQALRNVTDDPAISAAKTPEELKAVLPEALQAEVDLVAQRAR